MFTFSFTWIAVLAVLGVIGSLLSGMLGIGGAIIKYPMLLYIPPIFGLTAFSAHEVSGIVAVEVFVTSLAGVWAYRKSGFLHKKLIIYMGGGSLAGSLIGSFGSHALSAGAVNIVYGILALIAAVMMLLPRKGADEATNVPFNKPLATVLAFIVGLASGIVGAGGGFMLVPIMLTILKIPMRTTIATSLAITFISSVGSSIGKVVTHQVDYVPAIILMIVGLIIAPLGARIGKKANVRVLQFLLALMICGTVIKIWSDIL